MRSSKVLAAIAAVTLAVAAPAAGYAQRGGGGGGEGRGMSSGGAGAGGMNAGRSGGMRSGGEGGTRGSSTIRGPRDSSGISRGSGRDSVAGRNWSGKGDRGPVVGRNDGDGRRGNHRRGRGHYRGGVWFAAPYYDYGYYGYSNSSCRWLHRRAVKTGSTYWWRRYRDCIND